MASGPGTCLAQSRSPWEISEMGDVESSNCLLEIEVCGDGGTDYYSGKEEEKKEERERVYILMTRLWLTI